MRGAIRPADRARPVVQVFARVAAEVIERALMRVQELRHLLIQRRFHETAPAVAECQYEHMQYHRLMAEVNAGRAPIDLALVAGGRLEPHARPLGQRFSRLQRLSPAALR